MKLFVRRGARPHRETNPGGSGVPIKFRLGSNSQRPACLKPPLRNIPVVECWQRIPDRNKAESRGGGGNLPRFLSEGQGD